MPTCACTTSLCCLLTFCGSYALKWTLPPMVLARPQSNMLKNLPIMLLEYIPKIFTYYALHASHYACIMLQYEQH